MAKNPGSTRRLSASRLTAAAAGRLAPDSQAATAVGLMSISAASSLLRSPARCLARVRRAPSKNAATSAARSAGGVTAPALQTAKPHGRVGYPRRAGGDLSGVRPPPAAGQRHGEQVLVPVPGRAAAQVQPGTAQYQLDLPAERVQAVRDDVRDQVKLPVGGEQRSLDAVEHFRSAIGGQQRLE